MYTHIHTCTHFLSLNDFLLVSLGFQGPDKAIVLGQQLYTHQIHTLKCDPQKVLEMGHLEVS